MFRFLQQLIRIVQNQNDPVKVIFIIQNENINEVIFLLKQIINQMIKLFV